jgi:ureidoglycolate hydrolase
VPVGASAILNPMAKTVAQMPPSLTVQQLVAQPITAEAFAPFGQLLLPSADSAPFGPQDAQLVFGRGIPRFYIMTLVNRGVRFRAITRHQCCTQCLGALGGKDWWVAVAPPSPTNQPHPTKIRAFQIPGNCFIKLEVGTWHAGPYFGHPRVDFYNLELSDTNIADHQTCNLAREFGMEFEIVA